MNLPPAQLPRYDAHAAMAFGVLGSVSYYLYGQEFIDHVRTCKSTPCCVTPRRFLLLTSH